MNDNPFTAEEVRAGFEKWLRSQGYDSRKDDHGNYVGMGQRDFWPCWQAAYADRLEADEKAKPVGWVDEHDIRHIRAQPDEELTISADKTGDYDIPLFTHHAPASSERLAEALCKLRKATRAVFKVSGSALLAGEKHRPADREVCHGVLCDAVNILSSIEDDLEKLATHATAKPVGESPFYVEIGSEVPKHWKRGEAPLTEPLLKAAHATAQPPAASVPHPWPGIHVHHHPMCECLDCKQNAAQQESKAATAGDNPRNQRPA